MTQPTRTIQFHSLGYSDDATRALRRFTAEANCAHVLPYLRPGLRALDFGCGTGSISLGLARAVAPGEFHGVDLIAAHVEWARSAAASQGQDNAAFHVIDDLARLPFPDGYFDAVNCHDILMYIPDTPSALAELRRVLKPGGIIGCREMICDSSFTFPDLGAMKTAWEVFTDLIAFDDGHPQMGKELKDRLLAAGFENVRARASFDTYGAPAEVTFISAFITQWFFSPDVRDFAVGNGLATAAVWDRMRVAFGRWKDQPEAMASVAYGEALANKP